MKPIECPEPWETNEKNIVGVLVVFLILFGCCLIILVIYYQTGLFQSNWLVIKWCLFPILIFSLLFFLGMMYHFRKGNHWSLSLPSSTNLLRNLAQDIESLLKQEGLNFSKRKKEYDNILQLFIIQMPSKKYIKISIRSNWISFNHKEEERKRLDLSEDKFSLLVISNITLRDISTINDIQSKIIDILDRFEYKNVLDDFY